jgi:choline dehydrogenase-like flavoprotein
VWGLQRRENSGSGRRTGHLPVRDGSGQLVLDVNGQAHEVDNLYVVDTSFFPSIGQMT